MQSCYTVANNSTGMFIFAELLAKYLEDQVSLTALREELQSDDSLVKLDHV